MQRSSPLPNTNTSMNPPKTLLSLPKELMADICSRLDQRSAISLLYVHRSFHQPAESRIYRDITLSLPTYWGEPVLHRPPGLHYGSEPYTVWAKKQSKEVEMIGRAEARRRAEEMIKILSRGPERWRYIRKLVIEPRVGANSAVVQILSLARDYVVEIEIIKSRDHIYRSQWQPRRGETIWAKLADFGPFETYTFPNLTSLSVELEDYDCASLPGHIIQRATRLEAVTLEGGKVGEADHDHDDDDVEDCDCELWASHNRSFGHPFSPVLRVADISCPAHEGTGDPPLLISQLFCTPSLEHLTIYMEGGTIEDREWAHDIFAHGNITHLNFDFPELPYTDFLECVEDISNTTLRSLIFKEPDISPADERLDRLDLALFADFKSLERIGIRVPNGRSNKVSVDNRYTPFNDNVHHPQSISSDVAQLLTDMESLETIQFMDGQAEVAFVPVEHWETTGTHGIVIRSLVHEGDTVFHTRTYSRSMIKKTSSTPEVETYTTSKYPRWTDATHYDGETPTLEVISSMRRSQGGIKPWMGRGVEVGKKAWKVLMNWKEKLHAESGKTGKVAGGAEGADEVKAEAASESEEAENESDESM